MRKVRLVAGLLAATAATVADTPADLRELVRKSLAGILREDERRSEFLFKVRNERKELDSDGKVSGTHSYVWERIDIEGFTFGRTLERDGKPLTAEERKSEDAAIQKHLAELKSSGQTTTPARRNSQEDWYQEFPEALDYTLAGEEVLNGRPTLRLAGAPRPGYQPKNLRARVFEKMKVSLWIDKATSELAKVDAEMFDSVAVGYGVVGRVDKGARFQLRRRPVADGIWLIDGQTVRFSARVLLFKVVRNESTTEWSEFRRRTRVVASR